MGKFLNYREEHNLVTNYYTDEYFSRSSRVLRHAGMNPEVVMQFFAKKMGIVAGLGEAAEILDYPLSGNFEWYSKNDGDRLDPRIPVLYIKGNYRHFAHLETPILGIIARRSLVASNTRKVVDAAEGKPVIFMPARHDDFRVQKGDGYAAKMGGATSVTTPANCAWIDGDPVGTMPHSLIACFRGDIAAATVAFHRAMQFYYPNKEIKTISLVDYNSHCAFDAVKAADAMKKEFGKGSLFAVRLDTSESVTDYSLQNDEDYYGMDLSGVNPHLVRKVRENLDDFGHRDVKIVVSGGFTPEKIKFFEGNNIPVDGYGVGSSILGHSSSKELYSGLDFTADIVGIDGEHEAKDGRGYVHVCSILGNEQLVK